MPETVPPPAVSRPYFPAFLDLRGRPCVVVGGGAVATRKIELLLSSGARVHVVSPELCPAIEALRASGRLTHAARTFRPADLAEAVIVVSATDDKAVNAAVADEARRLRLPVNVVDDPAQSTFIMASIVDRGPITIAVSSGGTSPVLARLMRARLEELVPAVYGRLAALAARFRAASKARFPDPGIRRRFWERVLDGPIAEMVFGGRERDAREALEQAIAEGDAGPQGGIVYLVGGGPGHPDLITLRALRVLQFADAVLYDKLVAPEIVALARRDADRIYVGKERDRHALPQTDINALLVQLAKAGKRVVRLKGGDPYIFGRGGEEIEALTEHGIPFEVVPGITAAAGAGTYAGIPLTHRDHAHACVFVTGHLKNGSLELDWAALARPQQTVVFYMGVQGLGIICARLIEHGLPADTPAAIVEQATLPRQRVVTGTLATLPERAAAADVRPPALTIVGDVVRLQEKLAWYTPGALDDPAPPSAGTARAAA